MSQTGISLQRDNRIYFQSHFTPAIPWNPIQLGGHYAIQSIFFELDLHPIQVRIHTPEDPEAIVLFPVHFGSKEYAYLFLTFQLYKLYNPRLQLDTPFADLLEFMDLALESNIYEEEVRLQILHAIVEHYDV